MLKNKNKLAVILLVSLFLVGCTKGNYQVIYRECWATSQDASNYVTCENSQQPKLIDKQLWIPWCFDTGNVCMLEYHLIK